MRKLSTFKKILLGIVIFFVIVYIGTLFIGKDYAVERHRTIDCSPHKVFDYVTRLKNQPHFMSWFQGDSLLKITSKGTDGTKGFVLSWDSPTSGQGEEEIINIDLKKRVDFELRFKKPIESTSYAYMTVDSLSETQSKLTWGFKGQTPYPSNVLMLFMDIDKVLGTHLEIGLDTLRAILPKACGSAATPGENTDGH